MQREVYIVRIGCLFAAVCAGFAALGRHLYDLQIARHEHFLERARRLYVTTRKERGTRGQIRDVNGNVLAGNFACYDIWAEPARFGDGRQHAAAILSRELAMPASYLERQFEATRSRRERYPADVVVASRVDAGVAERIRERRRRARGYRLRAKEDEDCAAEYAFFEAVKLQRPPLPPEATDRGWLARCFWKLRELLRRGDLPSDVAINTWYLRGPRKRAHVFDTLGQLPGMSPQELERVYTEATGDSRFPEQVVVKRGVELSTAERLRTCCDVVLRPRSLTRGDIPHVACTLAQELGVHAGGLQRKLFACRREDDGAAYVTVARGVALERVDRLRKYRFPGLCFPLSLRGLRFVDSSRRYYPKGRLLAHLVGFVNSEGEGVAGIEELRNDRLQPAWGERVYERDPQGKQIQDGALSAKAPRDGASVYLTIDEPIQHIVEDELAYMAEQFRPKAAYAIMANPKTGAVMAIAQRPTFDPNRIRKEDAANLENRLLLTGFEPGSVMKPIAVCGAFDFGVAGLDSVYDCEDGYWPACRLHDCHEYGMLTVREILEKSSNVGTAKIATEMGKERLYQVLRRFGFGRPTGIGFSREAPGIYRPLPKWDGLSISRFAIGQGILVTPLQMVSAYCALANGGVMMQLYVIDRIEHPDASLVEVTAPTVRSRASLRSSTQAVVEALKLVTKEEGTAPKAAVEGYEVAGKTGTAQKCERGQYSHTKFVSSFVGFVPADDPAFVLMVIADEPDRRRGYYGGTVAAPTFSRIAEQTLRYLEIAPANPRRPYCHRDPEPETNAVAHVTPRVR